MGLDDAVDSKAASDRGSVAVFAGRSFRVGFQHISVSAAFVGTDGRDGSGRKIGVDEFVDILESFDVAEHVESGSTVESWGVAGAIHFVDSPGL